MRQAVAPYVALGILLLILFQNQVPHILEFFKNNKDAFLSIGPLLSVFGILYVASLNDKSARSHRILDHRVRWIESLRVNISNYLAVCKRITSNAAICSTAPSRSASFADDIIKDLYEIKALQSLIDLSLNLDEPAQKDLQKTLFDIQNTSNKILYCVAKVDGYSAGKMKDFNQYIDNKEEELQRIARLVFKSEWEKAKQGI